MAVPVISTSGDADRIQLELLRAASPAQRLRLARSLSATVVELARRAIRTQSPDLDDRQVALRFAELHYGRELADKVRSYLRHRGR